MPREPWPVVPNLEERLGQQVLSVIKTLDVRIPLAVRFVRDFGGGDKLVQEAGIEQAVADENLELPQGSIFAISVCDPRVHASGNVLVLWQPRGALGDDLIDRLDDLSDSNNHGGILVELLVRSRPSDHATRNHPHRVLQDGGITPRRANPRRVYERLLIRIEGAIQVLFDDHANEQEKGAVIGGINNSGESP